MKAARFQVKLCKEANAQPALTIARLQMHRGSLGLRLSLMTVFRSNARG